MVYRAPLVVTVNGVQPAVTPLPLEQDCALPAPANENLKLKSDWMTPAEALQSILRIKRRLVRENKETHVLLMSAHRRRIWGEVLSAEACLRWKYFR